jgi:pimeloyl-ACP methyl ester carboxylesterase
MIRTLLAALLAAATVAAPPDLYTKPQLRAALPDGRHINLACLGEGGPVVILDPGLGLPSMVWSKLQPLLAQHRKVCAIDRPGYGFSDPGPLPRTALRTAQDFEAALKAAGLKPPFVFVAHSRGGYDARLFAHLYPQQTAGLVLVDVNPGVPHPKDAPRPNTEPPPRDPCIVATAEGRMHPGDPAYVACGSPPPGSDITNRDRAKAALSEADNIDTDDAAVTAITTYGRTPMIVLTADIRKKGTPPEKVAVGQATIDQAHQALAAQSRRGEWRYVEGAGHMIMFERPDVVAQAVEDVIGRARTP